MPRLGPPPSAVPPDAARGRGLREKLGAVPEIFCCSLDGRHLNVFQAFCCFPGNLVSRNFQVGIFNANSVIPWFLKLISC